MKTAASPPATASSGENLLRQALEEYQRHLARSDFPGALKALNHAADLAPDHADILIHRGRVALVLRDFEAAGRDFASALKLNPQCAPAFSGLARLYLASGNAIKAEFNAYRAMGLNPADHDAAAVLRALNPTARLPVAPPANGQSNSIDFATRPSGGCQADVATATAQKICLATNYLLMTESTRKMWSELGRHLEQHGCQLVLFSTTAPEPALPFPVYPHPYLMRDFAAAFPLVARHEGVSATPREWEWLQADMSRAPGGYPLGDALVGLAAFRAFMRQVLGTLQPGLVLIADNTLCQTALLQKACLDAGIPVQIYERGLLPETLMLDSRGMQAWSDMRTHWLAQELPASAPDAAAYERIRSYYRTRLPQKYAQPDFGGGGTEVRRRFGLEGRRMVVFLGGGYEANGHAPKGGIYERHFYTGFPTTEEALLALGRAVARTPGTALIFKPHPLDANACSAATKEGVLVVRDVNVHALIDAADVVAAQYTTLQFEAVLFEKPILLLARSAWWGRHAAYEVESPADLPAKLEAALQRRDWPAHQANARAFTTWMMDHVLIGCTPEVPARRNLRDLARFIARTAVAPPPLPSPEQRWERTTQALETLKTKGTVTAW